VGVNVDAAHLYLRASMTSASSRAVTCPVAWLDLATANISQEDDKKQQLSKKKPQVWQTFMMSRAWGILFYYEAD